jgi:deoxycytidylate deaminase
MLIHSSSQLLTLAGCPQRGHALGTLGIIENGAVIVRDKRTIAVSATNARRACPCCCQSRCAAAISVSESDLVQKIDNMGFVFFNDFDLSRKIRMIREQCLQAVLLG